jgi:UDP-N-acetyl-2-amino-2-deoxyglucuronate dehydrogenase
MAPGLLSAAVIGLGSRGQLLLEAAQAGRRFEIKAVGDPDRQRTDRSATRYGCAAYTDCRQLLVQNEFDAVLFAADIHACDELIKTAIRRRFNVLKMPPPGRTFAEVLGLAEMARSEGIRFTVANPLRFRSSYRLAKSWIAEGRVSQIFLVTAQCRASPTIRASWQSDPVLAGGGVLLYDGYALMDQILKNLPVPQQVYALHSSQASDKGQRLYLTEDTAAVSLKFSDALTGSFIVTRSHDGVTKPSELKIHGRDVILSVTDDRAALIDLRDGSETAPSFQESEQDIAIRILDAFARNLDSPGAPSEAGTLAEDLKNMAVLESAYLSARTGFPEEPDRVLQRARNFPPTGLTRA